MSGYTEPVDDRVREKVMDLVKKGITQLSVLDNCIVISSRMSFFRDETPPESGRRRYRFPI